MGSSVWKVSLGRAWDAGMRISHVGERPAPGKDGENSVQRQAWVPEKPSPFSGQEAPGSTGSKAEHTVLLPLHRDAGGVCPEGSRLHVFMGLWLTFMGELSRRCWPVCRVCPGEGGAGRGGSPLASVENVEAGFILLHFQKRLPLCPRSYCPSESLGMLGLPSEAELKSMARNSHLCYKVTERASPLSWCLCCQEGFIFKKIEKPEKYCPSRR